MTKRAVILLAALILLSVAVLSTAWEFALEDKLLPYLLDTHQEEPTIERWEFVFTSLGFAGLSLILPILLALRLIEGQGRAEQALRESQAHLTEAQGLAKIGHWRWSIERDELDFCSEEYARIHGVSMQEIHALLRNQMTAVVHPEDRDRVERAFRRYDEEGSDYAIEYRIRRPDGETRHVLELGEALFDDRGRPIAQAGTLQDITERKRTEEALREAQDRFRTLVEHAPEAVVLLNPVSGRFVEVNANAEKLFGLPRERLLEMGPVELSPPFQPNGEASAEAARPWIEQALEGATPVFEWTHCSADKRPVTCELRLVRLSLGGRALVRGSIIDITERKELEAQLRQTRKMEAVGQLTGGIAHDFNNLLAIIYGNLELARDRCAESDRLLELLGPALHAAERGADLTRQLLAFSRKETLQPSALDLDEVISGMTDLLRRTLGATIEIEVVCEEGLGLCYADRGQLENALLNLAINARDAMPRGGKLRIESRNLRLGGGEEAEGAAAPQDYVALDVTDTGSGMPAEVRERAFEPFYTTKSAGRGSGLGLSMVYGFAAQSGGRVTIESEPGQGTSVHLLMPRAAQEQAPRSSLVVESGTDGEGETILLVEDEPDVRALTAKILADLGYEVIAAGDGEAALKLLEERDDLDLLLSDVVLPGGWNGYEIAAEVMRRRPGIRVLLMSGYADETQAPAGSIGPDLELLDKPFRKRDLALRVRQALDREHADASTRMAV